MLLSENVDFYWWTVDCVEDERRVGDPTSTANTMQDRRRRSQLGAEWLAAMCVEDELPFCQLFRNNFNFANGF